MKKIFLVLMIFSTVVLASEVEQSQPIHGPRYKMHHKTQRSIKNETELKSNTFYLPLDSKSKLHRSIKSKNLKK